MNKSVKKLSNDVNSFRVRPNAEDGLWVAFILPASIILGVVKHPLASSLLFKLCAVFSVGLFLTALVFLVQYRKTKNIGNVTTVHVIPGVIVAVICSTFFGKGFPFSLYSGLASSLLFYELYLYILKHFPQCFTLGEAFLITQGLLLYSYSTVLSITDAISKEPITPFQISTLIIQVGLFCVGLLCFLPYKYRYLRKTVPFYSLTAIVVVFILLIPLHVLLGRSSLLWIWDMLFSDSGTVKIVIYWCCCCTVAVVGLYKQIQEARKASTVVRKTFHIVAVCIFLPGLIYHCCLLYLASGVIFGFLILLELLRILNLPPLGIFLQDGFFVFSDEKDIGDVSLTPLYLLVGCSVPLWIHPAPCELTNSAGFNLLPLLSGLLSVGIGDTAASYVGSYIGRHKWSGSKKTIEGTFACIVSQIFSTLALIQLGFIGQHQNEMVKVTAAIIVTSVVEAKTNQVDNLILPLVMYIMLV